MQNQVDLDNIPRSITITSEPDALYIRCRKAPFPFWILLIGPLITFGLGIYFFVTNPGDNGILLGGVMFLCTVIPLFMDAIVVFFIFSHHIRVRAETPDSGEIVYFQGISRLGRTRRIAWTPETTVTVEKAESRRNNGPTDEIVIRTDDAELRLGAAIPKPEKTYLATLLSETTRNNHMKGSQNSAMDSIRQILLDLEKNGRIEHKHVRGSRESEVERSYYKMIVDEEFAKSADHTDDGNIMLLELTWKGCDFLKDTRDPTVWEKTKEAACKKGGWTASTLFDTAKSIAVNMGTNYLTGGF